MVRYYFFKFPKDKKGEKETQFEYWTSGNNVVGQATLTVYFGESTLADLRRWKAEEGAGSMSRGQIIGELGEKKGGENYDDLKTVYEACQEPRDAMFLVSNESDQHMSLLMYKPIGELEDLNKDELGKYHETFPQRTKQKPKTVPVQRVGDSINRFSPKTPTIIATLSSDQALSRGTCNELRPEQTEALEIFLGIRHASELVRDEPLRLLKYLSPVQFETLVFLNFHERYFHCQAYRGSTVEGFDFRVERTSRSEQDFLPFNDKSMLGIQVKRKSFDKTAKLPVDLFVISLENPNSPSDHLRIRGGSWLLRKTMEQPRCFEWLKKELSWTGLTDKELKDSLAGIESI